MLIKNGSSVEVVAGSFAGAAGVVRSLWLDEFMRANVIVELVPVVRGVAHWIFEPDSLKARRTA